MKLIICVFFVHAWLILISSMAVAKNGKWDESLALEITRCFPVRDFKVHCEDFSYKDHRIIKIVQELQIEVEDYFGVKRSYGYGKAIGGPLCQEHIRIVRRLLKSTDQVCVTGDGEMTITANETYSRWRGVSTKNGSYRW